MQQTGPDAPSHNNNDYGADAPVQLCFPTTVYVNDQTELPLFNGGGGLRPSSKTAPRSADHTLADAVTHSNGLQYPFQKLATNRNLSYYERYPWFYTLSGSFEGFKPFEPSTWTSPPFSNWEDVKAHYKHMGFLMSPYKLRVQISADVYNAKKVWPQVRYLTECDHLRDRKNELWEHCGVDNARHPTQAKPMDANHPANLRKHRGPNPFQPRPWNFKNADHQLSIERRQQQYAADYERAKQQPTAPQDMFQGNPWHQTIPSPEKMQSKGHEAPFKKTVDMLAHRLKWLNIVHGTDALAFYIYHLLPQGLMQDVMIWLVLPCCYHRTPRYTERWADWFTRWIRRTGRCEAMWTVFVLQLLGPMTAIGQMVRHRLWGGPRTQMTCPLCHCLGHTYSECDRGAPTLLSAGVCCKDELYYCDRGAPANPRELPLEEEVVAFQLERDIHDLELKHSMLDREIEDREANGGRWKGDGGGSLQDLYLQLDDIKNDKSNLRNRLEHQRFTIYTLRSRSPLLRSPRVVDARGRYRCDDGWMAPYLNDPQMREWGRHHKREATPRKKSSRAAPSPHDSGRRSSDRPPSAGGRWGDNDPSLSGGSHKRTKSTGSKGRRSSPAMDRGNMYDKLHGMVSSPKLTPSPNEDVRGLATSAFAALSRQMAPDDSATGPLATDDPSTGAADFPSQCSSPSPPQEILDGDKVEEIPLFDGFDSADAENSPAPSMSARKTAAKESADSRPAASASRPAAAASRPAKVPRGRGRDRPLRSGRGRGRDDGNSRDRDRGSRSRGRGRGRGWSQYDQRDRPKKQAPRGPHVRVYGQQLDMASRQLQSYTGNWKWGMEPTACNDPRSYRKDDGTVTLWRPGCPPPDRLTGYATQMVCKLYPHTLTYHTFLPDTDPNETSWMARLINGVYVDSEHPFKTMERTESKRYRLDRVIYYDALTSYIDKGRGLADAQRRAVAFVSDLWAKARASNEGSAKFDVYKGLNLWGEDTSLPLKELLGDLVYTNQSAFIMGDARRLLDEPGDSITGWNCMHNVPTHVPPYATDYNPLNSYRVPFQCYECGQHSHMAYECQQPFHPWQMKEWWRTPRPAQGTRAKYKDAEPRRRKMAAENRSRRTHLLVNAERRDSGGLDAFDYTRNNRGSGRSPSRTLPTESVKTAYHELQRSGDLMSVLGDYLRHSNMRTSRGFRRLSYRKGNGNHPRPTLCFRVFDTVPFLTKELVLDTVKLLAERAAEWRMVRQSLVSTTIEHGRTYNAVTCTRKLCHSVLLVLSTERLAALADKADSAGYSQAEISHIPPAQLRKLTSFDILLEKLVEQMEGKQDDVLRNLMLITFGSYTIHTVDNGNNTRMSFWLVLSHRCMKGVDDLELKTAASSIRRAYGLTASDLYAKRVDTSKMLPDVVAIDGRVVESQLKQQTLSMDPCFHCDLSDDTELTWRVWSLNGDLVYTLYPRDLHSTVLADLTNLCSVYHTETVESFRQAQGHEPVPHFVRWADDGMTMAGSVTGSIDDRLLDDSDGDGDNDAAIAGAASSVAQPQKAAKDSATRPVVESLAEKAAESKEAAAAEPSAYDLFMAKSNKKRQQLPDEQPRGVIRTMGNWRAYRQNLRKELGHGIDCDSVELDLMEEDTGAEEEEQKGSSHSLQSDCTTRLLMAKPLAADTEARSPHSVFRNTGNERVVGRLAAEHSTYQQWRHLLLSPLQKAKALNVRLGPEYDEGLQFHDYTPKELDRKWWKVLQRCLCSMTNESRTDGVYPLCLHVECLATTNKFGEFCGECYPDHSSLFTEGGQVLTHPREMAHCPTDPLMAEPWYHPDPPMKRGKQHKDKLKVTAKMLARWRWIDHALRVCTAARANRQMEAENALWLTGSLDLERHTKWCLTVVPKFSPALCDWLNKNGDPWERNLNPVRSIPAEPELRLYPTIQWNHGQSQWDKMVAAGGYKTRGQALSALCPDVLQQRFDIDVLRKSKGKRKVSAPHPTSDRKDPDDGGAGSGSDDDDDHGDVVIVANESHSMVAVSGGSSAQSGQNSGGSAKTMATNPDDGDVVIVADESHSMMTVSGGSPKHRGRKNGGSTKERALVAADNTAAVSTGSTTKTARGRQVMLDAGVDEVIPTVAVHSATSISDAPVVVNHPQEETMAMEETANNVDVPPMQRQPHDSQREPSTKMMEMASSDAAATPSDSVHDDSRQLLLNQQAAEQAVTAGSTTDSVHGVASVTIPTKKVAKSHLLLQSEPADVLSDGGASATLSVVEETVEHDDAGKEDEADVAGPLNGQTKGGLATVPYMQSATDLSLIEQLNEMQGNDSPLHADLKRQNATFISSKDVDSGCNSAQRVTRDSMGLPDLNAPSSPLRKSPPHGTRSGTKRSAGSLSPGATPIDRGNRMAPDPQMVRRQDSGRDSSSSDDGSNAKSKGAKRRKVDKQGNGPSTKTQ